jgi:hypothetical protein
LQITPLPQLVPLVSCTELPHTCVPVEHEYVPLWHESIVQPPPDAHDTHVPPLHTMPVPQPVPLAPVLAFPVSVHVWDPLMQEVVPR